MQRYIKKIGTLLLSAVMMASFTVPAMATTSQKAVCAATVQSAKLTLSQTSVAVGVGATKTIKATVVGESKIVKWSSSNKSIATVSASGVVKGIKKGTCKITARANGITKSCTVKVDYLPTKEMLNAYANKLRQYGSSYNFGLIYFDDNLKPELVVTYNYGVHVSKGELFTYRNGKVLEIKGAGSDFGRLIYVPKKSVAINNAWINGYGDVTNFLKYDSNYKYKKFAAFEAGYASPTASKMTYKYNKSKVSKATYDSKMKTYNKKYPGKEITPSKLFSINNTNINQMVNNYKSVIVTGK